MHAIYIIAIIISEYLSINYKECLHKKEFTESDEHNRDRIQLFFFSVSEADREKAKTIFDKQWHQMKTEERNKKIIHYCCDNTRVNILYEFHILLH